MKTLFVRMSCRETFQTELLKKSMFIQIGLTPEVYQNMLLKNSLFGIMENLEGLNVTINSRGTENVEGHLQDQRSR